jgi:hypothetical protein
MTTRIKQESKPQSVVDFPATVRLSSFEPRYDDHEERRLSGEHPRFEGSFPIFSSGVSSDSPQNYANVSRGTDSPALSELITSLDYLSIPNSPTNPDFSSNPQRPLMSSRPSMGRRTTSAQAVLSRVNAREALKLPPAQVESPPFGHTAARDDGLEPHQFRVQWLSHQLLPFYRIQHVNNPWNNDRAIQISRDGTELEPSIGGWLISEWNKLAQDTPSSNTVVQSSIG